MSLISYIFGSDDDEEITAALYCIANVSWSVSLDTVICTEKRNFRCPNHRLVLQNTAGLGLIHESQSIYDASDYTRPWFAWANSYFAEMILDLAKRKPWLIFATNESYVVKDSFD